MLPLASSDAVTGGVNVVLLIALTTSLSWIAPFVPLPVTVSEVPLISKVLLLEPPTDVSEAFAVNDEPS